LSNSPVTLADVITLVRRQLRGNATREMGENTRLEDLGLSSLQISDLVFSLEEQYDLELDTARAAGIRTLGDVVALAAASPRPTS